MKYRYYVHDNNKNVGVCEFATLGHHLFVECLIDCINWFAWECDDTLFYEFYVYIDDKKILITYNFNCNDDMEINFFYDGKNYTVDRDYISDFVKSHF